MELKDYLTVLKKNIVFILTLSAFGVILAIFITRAMPTGYQKSQTFFLSQPDSEPGNLPDYYSQEKARNFTDTSVAILDSPDMRSEVQSSGQSLTVRKVAPQVIRITSTADSPQAAQTLQEKVVNTFNSKMQAINQNQANVLQLKEISASGEPVRQAVNKKVFAMAGAILGFTAAIFAISLKTYFKL